MATIKSIKLSKTQWRTISHMLHDEYPRSVFMIRDRMRARLGFTARSFYGLVDGVWTDVVYLDFYSEQKRTMFLLKYSDQITAKQREGDLI